MRRSPLRSSGVPASSASSRVFTRAEPTIAASAYAVTSGTRHYRAGSWHCVGGQSVFYGCASFRFRERDFETTTAIVGDSGAAWPFRYDAMEPFYTRAENLLGVAGEANSDPTEPPRSMPYPRPPAASASSTPEKNFPGRVQAISPAYVVK